MSKFAVMSNDKVINVIVADNKEQAEKDLKATLIESTDENPASIGSIYIDGKFYKNEETEEVNNA